MDKFEELTVPHLGTLYRQAYYLAGNRDDAEDMVQDTYVKARRSFHTLKDSAKCKPWLNSILYRIFIDEYRRKKHYVELTDVPAQEPEDDDSRWPEGVTAEGIKTALESLDPKYRLPLVAHYLSGQSYQEIADTMEIPLGTVMSRIHRAKRTVKKEFARHSRPSLGVIHGGRHGM